MSLDTNLALAARAIKYLKKLDITSTNVGFRISSSEKSPFSKFDRFLMYAMRVDTQNQRLDTPQIKERRKMLLDVLRDRKLSKSQIKEKAKTYMAYWGYDYFDTGRSWASQIQGEELRIRSVRKAIKFRHGNCMEKSAIIATYLREFNPSGPQQIVWMSGAPWDHAFCVFDSGSNQFDPTIANWSDDAVMVDGWTGDYYQAKNPTDLRKGVHLPNPFQIKIRRMIAARSGSLHLVEMLSYAASQFAPGFRLADAEKSKHAPPAADAPNVDDLQGVADNLAAIRDEMDD